MESQAHSRVFHIDTLRGVAILMMLQGHFVDTLLMDAHRVGVVHDFWKFCRGLTAPVFFTTSGVIVVYLLVRKTDLVYRQKRIKRAFWRGLEVLMWGYVLRFNIWPYLLEGKVYPEFWKVDVLHCIGLGMVLLFLIFLVFYRTNPWLLRSALFFAALGIFLLEPVFLSWDYSNWPPAIRNYFTMNYSSVFSISPFLGYLLAGGFIGSLYTVLYERNKLVFIAGLLLTGTFLSFFSGYFLVWCNEVTGAQLFMDIAWNNAGLTKLGNVLFIYSFFVSLEPLMAQLKVINKLGQHTLTVYIIHFFILYGSIFGLGIDDILFDKRSLPPVAIIPGALTFVVLVSWLTLRYHRWKATW